MTRPAPVRLIAKAGRLYIPNSYVRDTAQRTWFGGDDVALICNYPATELREWPERDFLPFPIPMDNAYWTMDNWLGALQLALYDARETGQLPAQTREVLLPDGSLISID